jgi:hypothetical protein
MLRMVMSRHAMPPAWLRMSGGHPHLLIPLQMQGRNEERSSPDFVEGFTYLVAM